MREDCIIWQGVKCKKGYGRAKFDGRQTTAHRAAYLKKTGRTHEDIKGLVVRHKCDNPSCVNPEHLEIGTYKDNSEDCIQRGRIARGEMTGQARLTEGQVREIRSMPVQPHHPEFGYHAISRKYGVSVQTIWNVVNRKVWDWV